MRAIVHDRYGSPDSLRIATAEVPTTRDDEVLVRVAATSVHVDIWHVVVGLLYALRLTGAGLLRPRDRVPGTDVAGVVESFGPAVSRLRAGDEVMGETGCGIQWRNGGAWAELASASEDGLVLKPAALTFEEAAAVGTPAVLAYEVLLDQAGLRAGQSLLVNEAGGGMGLWVVQLAVALGASRVVGVDHPDKLELLRVATGAHAGWHVRPRGSRPVRAGMNRWTGSIGGVLGNSLLAPFHRQLPGVRRSTPRAERLAHLARLLCWRQVRCGPWSTGCSPWSRRSRRCGT